MQKGGKQPGNDYRAQISGSQNFITEKKLIQRIIHLSNINKEDTIIEIGTGKGHLTDELCRVGGFVHSVELDSGLYQKAKARLAPFSNLTLTNGDFLKYYLPAWGKYKVFANIPYFITTQIVDKLTQAPNPPTDIWLIMEKGAAKRFAGVTKETEKSLLLKVNWEMKVVYYFRREDFHPMPSVDSVMLHFARKAPPDLNKREYAAFKNFITISKKYGFGGKKSLLTRKQVSTALKRAGLPQAYEDGVTLYIQWLCLFRCYRNIL